MHSHNDCLIGGAIPIVLDRIYDHADIAAADFNLMAGAVNLHFTSTRGVDSSIVGGDGNDTLLGGATAGDTRIGVGGDDFLEGGDGMDAFEFWPCRGSDTTLTLRTAI